MKTSVGRTYRFRAIHSLPDFPEPWCFTHEHDYTVEVEAADNTDTAVLDNWWGSTKAFLHKNLNEDFEPSTVENIAATLLTKASASIRAITVWEDKQRWGRAER